MTVTSSETTSVAQSSSANGSDKSANTVTVTENNDAGDKKTKKSYSEKEFWDERFGNQDKEFDWYATYAELKIFFDKHEISRQAKILIVGAGTSKLG